MKKILCAFLATVMLAMMIPAFALTASAEEGELTGRLNVTHVSASDTTKDWSKMWDITNTTRLGYQFDNALEFVGKFDKPTKVTLFVISSQYYNSRMNGIKVYFSADGENWDSAAVSISGLNNTVSGNLQFNYPISIDEEYSYVKIAKDTANSNSKYEFDIQWVAFYNNPREANNNYEKVYAVSQDSNAGKKNASVLWDYSNETAVAWGNSNTGKVMITGEFATPTVIKDIYFKLQSGSGARNEFVSIEASTDGSSWTKIAQSGKVGNAYTDIVLHSNSKTAYKFVRLVKNVTYTFGLTAIGIVGEAQKPVENTTEADFVGVQTKIETEDWSLRLISTVDSLDYRAVGYEINVTGDISKSFDECTQTVYSSIVDDLGTRYAEALGGKYIFTATVHTISIEKYDNLIFEIKPYVIDMNGDKIYGGTYTYEFIDGVVQQ